VYNQTHPLFSLLLHIPINPTHRRYYITTTIEREAYINTARTHPTAILHTAIIERKMLPSSLLI
jgi:hypothetical protein